MKKKSVHIFTGVQSGTPQQQAPITEGSRHRSFFFQTQIFHSFSVARFTKALSFFFQCVTRNIEGDLRRLMVA